MRIKRTNELLNLGKRPRKKEANFSTAVRQGKTTTFGPQKFIAHQGLALKQKNAWKNLDTMRTGSLTAPYDLCCMLKRLLVMEIGC